MKKAPKTIDEIFEMDTNNDELLSKSEVKGKLAESFDKIDVNNDGFISKAEMQEAPKPKRGNRPPKNQ